MTPRITPLAFVLAGMVRPIIPKTMKARFTKDWRNHKKGDTIRLQANVFMHLKNEGVIEFLPDEEQPKKEEVKKEAPKRGRKPKAKE